MTYRIIDIQIPYHLSKKRILNNIYKEEQEENYKKNNN